MFVRIGQRGSTTNVNIRIRGAKLWMLLCIFMTEDDLVQHLCEWTPTSKSSSSTAKNHNDAIAAEIELVLMSLQFSLSALTNTLGHWEKTDHSIHCRYIS
jgi:hypothetical protein